jgi:hypothetical protein
MFSSGQSVIACLLSRSQMFAIIRAQRPLPFRNLGVTSFLLASDGLPAELK